jgi:Flp pilus assembly protein TadG
LARQDSTDREPYRKTTKITSFAKDRSGSVAIVFALSLLPVLGIAGAALDYGRATSERVQLQGETDRAALAAALMSADSHQRAAAAQAIVTASGPARVSTSVDGTSVTVTATRTVKSMLRLSGADQLDVTTRSVAARSMKGSPACVLALDHSASGAITFSGSATFVGTGCGVQSNSTSATALVTQGSTSAKAEGLCSVGGVNAAGDVTPSPSATARRSPTPSAIWLDRSPAAAQPQST